MFIVMFPNIACLSSRVRVLRARLINNVNLAKTSCGTCLLFNDERIIRRRPAGRDVSIRLVE